MSSVLLPSTGAIQLASAAPVRPPSSPALAALAKTGLPPPMLVLACSGACTALLLMSCCSVCQGPVMMSHEALLSPLVPVLAKRLSQPPLAAFNGRACRRLLALQVLDPVI